VNSSGPEGPNRIARRPKFSALENRKLHRVGLKMPEWRDALRRYLKKFEI